MVREKVFARVGELIQGRLNPVDHYIIPGLRSQDFYTETFVDDKIHGEELKASMRKAVHLFAHYKRTKEVLPKGRLEEAKGVLFMEEEGIQVSQVTNIPFGKGFTSQSADVLSLFFALNKYFSLDIAVDKLYVLASVITVVDPCLEKDIAQIFDPLNGKRIFHLPEINLAALYFDTCPECVSNPNLIYDSIQPSDIEMEQYSYLMEYFQQGLLTNDYKPIYEATWKSAQINEIYNPKVKLGVLKEYADANQLGVFVSHVGSYCGVYGPNHAIQAVQSDFEDFVNRFWGTKVFYCLNDPESVSF